MSTKFTASNGVKQGAILSPILFSVYMDELFERLRWVYTSDGVKRRMRRPTMRLARRFAALAGAVLQASTCASVLVKSINARAYKAWQKLNDFQNTV